MTRRLTLAGAAVALAAGGAALWPYAPLAALARAESTSAGERDADPLPVRVRPATLVDSFERLRVYTGTLVAARRSVLSFERAGKLVELAVDEGDRVEAGQPLARLDSRRLEARRAQTEAELAEATATLRELVAGPRAEVIAAAEAELRDLASQAEVARRNLERRARLVESRAVSREEYDDALFLLRAAEARRDGAQQRLDELNAGTREERLDAQRARVGSTEARLADVNHELDDAVLVAPYGGQIAARRLDEGAVISAGQGVLDLIEDTRLEAWVGLPSDVAGRVRVGDSVEVTVEGAAHQAVVKSVRPELDPQTRTQNVVLRFEGTAREGSPLVAGRMVRIGLREPVEGQGYWLPTASLSPRLRGLWCALVVDEKNTVATRDVEVIEVDGDRSFVRGALLPGERVVVEGAHRVVAGQEVRPVETAPTFARDEHAAPLPPQ
ncbi:MAG: efflux RND transporter periplasmic adaptor subunit [Lacipirellulaceae bacterium]